MSLNKHDWPTYFDNTGRLLDEYKLRKTAFFSGISPDLRGDVWPVLVGLWPADSSSTQRHALSEQLKADYERIRNGWINAVPELMDSEMKQSIKVIDKDVRRTDREHPMFEQDGSEGMRKLRRVLITLSVYDSELAYVQGMNELLSPFLLLLQEEHLVFWCFTKLLPALRQRLLTLDLSPQLSALAALTQHTDPELHQHVEMLTEGHWIFSFRWFLLLFKNEFSLTDIFTLWDVLFAQHITTHMEIFIACSILLIYKEQVLACSTSDQLLYLAQSLTSKLKVSHLIQRARDLAVQMGNSKGLSEQLSALLIQTGKVPPPLVGFVRRRQCFTNVYNGRQHMNDDMIKMLMGGSRVVQNKPLFFNCTEASVPVPGENFLQGISGAQPMTVSDQGGAPNVAAPVAPPTGRPTGGYVPYSTLRTRRPDALQKDSFSAREHTPSYQQQHQVNQAQQAVQHQAQQPDQYQQQGNNGQYQQPEGLVGQQYGQEYGQDAQPVACHSEQTVEELYEQYQQQRQEYEQQQREQYDQQQREQYDQQQHQEYEQQQREQYDQQQRQEYEQQQREQREQYDQQQYVQQHHKQQHLQHNLQQHQAEQSQQSSSDQAQQPSQQADYQAPANNTHQAPARLHSIEELYQPQAPVEQPTEGLVAQQGALSAIDDDFWGLSISLQSDAALS